MSSPTPTLSVVFFVIAALLGAIGQYLYKSGANLTTDNPWTYANPRILGGVVCYLAVMVLFVAAFKKGGALSVLYPIYATTFIWAAIIAYFAFGTPIKPIHALGMALLVLGMYLMGR